MFRTINFLVVVTTLICLCDHANADHELKVSPADELLIIDPNVDPQKRPTPTFVMDPRTHTQRVEIPPTVIVHRYYYTGNRNFQGPMLPGGPTVLVMNHPHSGEQVSVNANLLPGAPRIHYNCHWIRYDYADRSICVDFGKFGLCEPKVIYQRNSALHEKLEDKAAEVHNTGRSFIRRTGIVEVASGLKRRTRDGFLAVGDRINQAGSTVVHGAAGVWDGSPAGRLFQPSAIEPSAAAARTGIIQELENSLPTNQ